MNNFSETNKKETKELPILRKIIGWLPAIFVVVDIIILAVYLFSGTKILNKSTSDIKALASFNRVLCYISLFLIIVNILWSFYLVSEKNKNLKKNSDYFEKTKLKRSVILIMIIMKVIVVSLLACSVFLVRPFNSSESSINETTFRLVGDDTYYLIDVGSVKDVYVSKGFSGVTIKSHILEKIVVNDDCTYVEFSNCYNLEQVVLGKGITEIPHNAFWRCESLKSIVSKSNVQSIGESAFFGCRSLNKLMLPESVAYIGENAFELCESLQTIDLGDSLKRIEENTFSECRELFYVNIPATVQSIDSQAFANCAKLKHIGFKGSKAQWNKIQLAPDWVDDTTGIKVYCNDGVLTLD